MNERKKWMDRILTVVVGAVLGGGAGIGNGNRQVERLEDRLHDLEWHVAQMEGHLGIFGEVGPVME